MVRFKMFLMWEMLQAVMIRHGKYFTTYCNLSTVSVSKEESVKTGQLLANWLKSDSLNLLFPMKRIVSSIRKNG